MEASQKNDRGLYALLTMVGLNLVPAALMPGVEDIILDPIEGASMGGFCCRSCGYDVERNAPELHASGCVLAVSHPGYPIE